MTNYRFARKKAATWIGALAIVAGVLAVFGVQAHAKSGYLSSFNSTYGTSGTALNSCTLCHPGSDTKTFNAYATAFGGAGHSFSAIENADSDGDGYSNIAEITARTFPGDAASMPATPTPPPPPPPPSDTTKPTVSSTNPVTGATAVPVTVEVTATFSEAVKSVSATTFTVMAGNSPVAGTVTLSGTTATFDPSAPLASATTYTATITTGVTDLANNALAANMVWTFTTGAAADTTPPTVTTTNPAASQAGVPANTAVQATFSEAMAGASITTATFTVADAAANPVAGTVTMAGTTATFAPSALLANGTTYTATVTTGARDLAGNGLATARTWSFTTVAAASDTDGDGVPDNMDTFPNDNRKATVPNPMGGAEMATIDTSANAGTRLMWADGMADTDSSLNQTGKPSGYTFPNGVVSYVVAGVAPGGTANVVISYPAAIPANSRVYKVDSAGFHEFPGAVINGNTVTLTLRDGGAGDADGVANGAIDDPVGLAAPVAAVPVASAPDGSGGGCSVAGTGGVPLDAAGAYGFLALIALGLLVKKASPGKR